MEESLVQLEPSSIPLGLHGLFNRLERHRPGGQQADDFIEEVFHTMKEDLCLSGVLVYGERRDGFELRKRVGEGLEALTEVLEAAWSSVASVLRHHVYIFADPSESDAPSAFRSLSGGPSAGVVVGRRPHRRLLFFGLDWGWDRERVDFALNVLRAALLVGFAIGDASGHGLPAALLVRDIVTGLRMGLEKHLRMEYVFSKLNRVIHRSNLSSNYVSAFYGELEPNGNVSYVNAGHQPPLLFRRDRILELRTGGTVIGPLPQVSYRRGLVRLDPGSVLVLFTDGIVERRGPGDEFFGEERLKRVVQESHGTPAAHLLDRILEVAFAHGEGRPWEDDVTVMVIRRPEE